MSEEQAKSQAMKEAVESVLKTDSIKSHIRNAFQRGWEARRKYDAEIIQQAKDDAYADGQAVAQTASTEEAYNKGLNEAFEAAKKILCYPQNGGFSRDELNEIFGTSYINQIFKQNSCREIIGKIATWEAKKQAEKEPEEPHWKQYEVDDKRYCECSKCQTLSPKDFPWMHCPNCGASMENGELWPF